MPCLKLEFYLDHILNETAVKRDMHSMTRNMVFIGLGDVPMGLECLSVS